MKVIENKTKRFDDLLLHPEGVYFVDVRITKKRNRR